LWEVWFHPGQATQRVPQHLPQDVRVSPPLSHSHWE